MRHLLRLTLYTFLLFPLRSVAQLTGIVQNEDEALPFAEIVLLNEDSTAVKSTLTDMEGEFAFEELVRGTYLLNVRYSGFKPYTQSVQLKTGQSLRVRIELEAISSLIDQVVITGTRTLERQSRLPLRVNVLESKNLQKVQACNLSEGLQFQPGLRVETDCQTCNYTQLRMNGLTGAYSQILINGRPIFSPLIGLYGLEQIPTTMIERIEVVRGAGSALYGSSAIGGTVNVITKLPEKTGVQLMSSTQLTGMRKPDVILSGNANAVHKDKRKGVSLFFNLRDRSPYDHNGDDYSEIPEIRAASVGVTGFLLPSKGQKLELSLSSLNEYRYGGELGAKEPHLAGQSEERIHHILVASLDHQINFNKNKSSFISYAAGQITNRDHFTGIRPDEPDEVNAYDSAAPYGISENYTWQAGLQINHRLEKLPGVRNTFTLGVEYLFDDIIDSIPSYNYLIDQNTTNLGSYLQHNWTITRKWTIVSGVRADVHSMLEKPILNPRISVMHTPVKDLQIRASAGSGFRAPQAFDADMHIAFAGGGVSRISLAPNLRAEHSKSYTLSINYDKVQTNWIAGLTIEGFYTDLGNSFYLHPIGEDQYGLQFEKRNGQGAVVKGITMEYRANLAQKIQIEGGITFQRSEFKTPIKVIESLDPVSRFLRTPNDYGFVKLDWDPNTKWELTLNGVYTGKMLMAHFAGAPEQDFDEFHSSDAFMDLGFKISRILITKKSNSEFRLFAGVKNMFNSYQSDFDTGKNRDSNYVYGPSLPRSIYFGIVFNSTK